MYRCCKIKGLPKFRISVSWFPKIEGKLYKERQLKPQGWTMEEENVEMSKAKKQGSFSWRPNIQRGSWDSTDSLLYTCPCQQTLFYCDWEYCSVWWMPGMLPLAHSSPRDPSPVSVVLSLRNLNKKRLFFFFILILKIQSSSSSMLARQVLFHWATSQPPNN